MEKILIDTCVLIAAIDNNSPHHKPANQFLEWAEKNQVTLSMPAHAYFEIWCTAKRLEKIDKIFVGRAINNKFQYPINFIYINEEFLRKYGNVELKHTKAGDHIFLVIAKLDNCPIVTLDKKMVDVANSESIKVFSPEEFIKNYM